MRGIDGVSLAEAALAERKRCDWSCLSLPANRLQMVLLSRGAADSSRIFGLIWIKVMPLESMNISKILNEKDVEGHGPHHRAYR